MLEEKGSKYFRGHFIWIFISLLLLAVVFFLYNQYISYKNKVNEMKEERDALVVKLETMKGSAFVHSKDIMRLKKQGLSNPVDDLIDDLMKHKELIPFKGVLGGTMSFYSKKDIHVLTSRWVLAAFEDGHIGGQMILEYTVSLGGKINWKVISAYLN
jgi:hypothetical protein